MTESTPERRQGATPVKSDPDTAEHEAFARGGSAFSAAVKRRSRFPVLSWLFQTFFRTIFGMIRLIVLTILVMGLAGVTGFKTVQRYVQGKTVAVPLIVNEETADALVLLGQMGLYLELDGTEYSDEKPAGFILDQRPAPDTRVKAGTPVRVKISSGPTLVVTPDLRGVDFKEAEIRLEQADLKRGRRSNLESRTVPQWAIVATDPPPLTQVRRGSTVNLLVSSGLPRYEISMPPLTGKTQEEAADLLSRLGLQIAEVREQARPDLPSGTVLGQTPEAGVRVDPLNSIIVTVAKGKGPG